MVAINAITRESMDMIVDEITNVMDSDYLSEESKGADTLEEGRRIAEED